MHNVAESSVTAFPSQQSTQVLFHGSLIII